MGGAGEGDGAALMWPLLPFIIAENLNLTPKMGLTTPPCHWLRTLVNMGVSPVSVGSGSCGHPRALRGGECLQ